MLAVEVLDAPEAAGRDGGFLGVGREGVVGEAVAAGLAGQGEGGAGGERAEEAGEEVGEHVGLEGEGRHVREEEEEDEGDEGARSKGYDVVV